MISKLLKNTDKAIAEDDGRKLVLAVGGSTIGGESAYVSQSRPPAPKPKEEIPTFKDLGAELVRLIASLQDAEDDIDAIEAANGHVPVVEIGARKVPLAMNREAMLVVKRNAVDELVAQFANLTASVRERANQLVNRDPDKHRSEVAAVDALKQALGQDDMGGGI